MMNKKRRIHCTKNKVFHYGFIQWMWPSPQETADLVTFTEEILNRKLHFLNSDNRTITCLQIVLTSDIQNRCSEKIHKAHKKILVFEYFFNKIVSWRPAILLISLICLLKRREKCSCFLVNFAKFSQQAFNRTHLVCLSRRISHLWIGANNIKVNLTRYIFCKNRSHFYSETRRNFEQVATNWLIEELSVAS